jgi:hypothetical protein
MFLHWLHHYTYCATEENNPQGITHINAIYFSMFVVEAYEVFYVRVNYRLRLLLSGVANFDN